MSLFACDRATARRAAAWLLCMCVACLALSAAVPFLALHLHLAAQSADTVDFLRGFLIGLAITLLALGAFLRRRNRQAPADC